MLYTFPYHSFNAADPLNTATTAASSITAVTNTAIPLYCWAPRRRANSHLMHALNGNGRRKGNIALPTKSSPPPARLAHVHAGSSTSSAANMRHLVAAANTMPISSELEEQWATPPGLRPHKALGP